MITKLETDTLITICNEENKCKYCENRLENINVELLHEGYNGKRWQKEKILCCILCNKYYINKSKLIEFNKKYPSYLIEHENYVEEKLKNFNCYILSKKAMHTTCKGMSTENQISIKYYVLENKEGLCHKALLKKCLICNNYIMTQSEYLNIKDYATKIDCNPAKRIESKLLYKKPNVNGIPTQLSSNSILSFDIDKCKSQNHGIIKMKLEIQFYVNTNSLVTKSIEGGYCEKCNKYLIDKKSFDSISNDRIPDCKLEEYNYKKDYFKEIELSGKADFIVRTNLIKCNSKNHIIEDIKAEVAIVEKNGNYNKRIINAYYCRDCNLFYMYNGDYNKLIQYGIPLCPIYEYEKYIKENNTNNYDLNQESILHAFGYNVNSINNITETQRRKILEYLINNNILPKHKIISYITYFINIHKGHNNFKNAIEKWESDIDYLKKIEMAKKYVVNSIKTVNYKKEKL